MVDRAGAIIVETMIRLKPVTDRTLVTTHFLRVAQSLGFTYSNPVEKLTRNGSSEAGAGAGAGADVGRTATAFFSQLLSSAIIVKELY